MKRFTLLTLAAGMALLSGCVSNPGDTRDLRQHSGPVQVQSQSRHYSQAEGGEHIVPVKTVNHAAYVGLDDIARATDLRGEWLWDGDYGLGDHDAHMKFKVGDSAVKVGSREVRMPAPAVREGSRLLVPVSGLPKLIGDIATYEVDSDRVKFFQRPVKGEAGSSGKMLNFSDAPRTGDGIKILSDGSGGGGDRLDMIAYAKQFLGVKYDFGAEDYEKSGKFDCSSFVQHVFGHFGIELPRLAREQAEKGRSVSRDVLQTGDLLFFYVPGRFKSDATVGHVGIYMGNGDMIQASPEPDNGVQISDINNDYWKETFLYARRIG